MSTLVKDIAQAFRSLRKQPTFALTAVLTLALGIGATSAIFSVVDAVLLRSLPYKDAGRLVHVAQDLRARNVEDFPIAPADFYDMKNLSSPFEDIASVFTFQQTFVGDGAGREAEQLPVAVVSSSLFRVLGLPILHGRDFVEQDNAPVPPPPAAAGGAPEAAAPPPPVVTILSHGYWQRRYNSDPSIIGTVQEFGAQRLEIVGVLAPGAELLFPPGIAIERTPDLWYPDRTDLANGSRINVFLRVIGRLRPEVTLTQAQGEIDALAADLRQQVAIKETADMHFRLAPMHEDLVAEVQPILMALMGAVAFVLLIACANVANLLLVRTAARERELAIRTALGGSLARLIRQLLAESLVLSLTASAVGLLLARLAIQGFRTLAPDNVPRLDTVAVDPTVVAFGVTLAVVSVAVF
ncbi:MAG: ABC transporter permease [Acidobacteria bacterium]|jgi:predicted permease|nr:ABC transporter permease [Acidobacteriota bacterium]